MCLAAFVGVQACATDGELNPQPLPPGGGDKNGGSGDFGADPSSPGASVDAGTATGEPADAEADCPDAGQTLDTDGGEEAGPLVDPDASCGDGG
ncbi:hypothetical protein AKJ09_03486 [Labilithrix luteola]|uniref:Uncharacterized protein n=1 Tax=Labilithrix luteola TaxID=1391654 RepID=A0A0K1PTI4_9BACT|nr:hypothetical protein AKJ09_03486 [Labilithrix luteola]